MIPDTPVFSFQSCLEWGANVPLGPGPIQAAVNDAFASYSGVFAVTEMNELFIRSINYRCAIAQTDGLGAVNGGLYILDNYMFMVYYTLYGTDVIPNALQQNGNPRPITPAYEVAFKGLSSAVNDGAGITPLGGQFPNMSVLDARGRTVVNRVGSNQIGFIVAVSPTAFLNTLIPVGGYYTAYCYIDVEYQYKV